MSSNYVLRFIILFFYCGWGGGGGGGEGNTRTYSFSLEIQPPKSYPHFLYCLNLSQNPVYSQPPHCITKLNSFTNSINETIISFMGCFWLEQSCVQHVVESLLLVTGTPLSLESLET